MVALLRFVRTQSYPVIAWASMGALAMIATFGIALWCFCVGFVPGTILFLGIGCYLFVLPLFK